MATRRVRATVGADAIGGDLDNSSNIYVNASADPIPGGKGDEFVVSGSLIH